MTNKKNEIDYSKWMSELGNEIGPLKLKNVYLPGTHDSHTKTENWGICKYSGIVRCQDKSPSDQLKRGIRYFDLRYRWWDNLENGQAYIFHGICTSNTKIWQTMNMVKGFFHPSDKKLAREREKEIVILDLSHWDGMSKGKHRRAVDEIAKRLRDIIVPSDIKPDVTVQELWHMRKNVIVIYHEDPHCRDKKDYHPQDDEVLPDGDRKLFWRAGSIWSPWKDPGVNNDHALGRRMRRYLGERTSKHHQDQLFVLQAQRSPSKDQWRAKLWVWAKQTNPKVISWLEDWTRMGYDDGDEYPVTPELVRENLNIVIVDFYEVGGSYPKGQPIQHFVPAIVDLNSRFHHGKLAEQQPDDQRVAAVAHS